MTVLKDLLLESKDGEWGEGGAGDGLIEMVCIRGTDFEIARLGMLEGIPRRFIKEHIAERKRLQSWDILIEAAGGSKDRPTGRTVLLKPSLFEQTQKPLICASFARFLRLDPAKADPAYVFWVLQDWYANGRIGRYHRQHTGVARFQYTSFASSEIINLPPLPTQRRIAYILSVYDDLIEYNTKRIKILEEMARVLYREWFVHFRFPGHEKASLGDSSPGAIPEGWDVSTIGETTHNFDRKRKPLSSMQRAEMQGGYPYYGAAKIFDYVNDYIFDGRYLLSAEDGSVITDDRRPVLQIATGKFWVNNHTHILQGKAPFSTDFIYLRLSELDISPYITGAAQPKITQANLNRIPVLVPPDWLLESFDQHICPMLALVDNLRAQNEILRRTRDLLLPRLISGSLDVSTLPLPSTP